MPCPIWLSQARLEDLARSALRQFAQQLDPLWDLETREARSTKCQDLVLGDGVLRLRDDKGQWHLAPALVRYADDRTLQHARMLVENFFDLYRGNVLPSADDHIF